MSELIDGKKIANVLLENLRREIALLPEQPVLCDVVVGDDPVSHSYVNVKAKTAERVGAAFLKAHYPASISEDRLVGEIARLSRLPQLCGLIVQLPLPGGFSRIRVLQAIDFGVDVDCIGESAVSAFFQGRPGLVPPTAGAIIAVLESLGLDFGHQKFVVIGQGDLVGKPVAFLLRQRGFNVAVADRQTPNLAELALGADVVISATGQPRLLTGSMVKTGSVVIDAGTAESEGGIVGDVDLESVFPKAAFISPVPGGVGPVTVAKLLANVVAVAKSKFGNKML